MITNERQYRISKAALTRHQTALEELDRSLTATQKDDPVMEVHRAALASQVEEFEQLVREYENLVDRKTQVFEVNRFGDLPTALIKARISTGLTQKELAERLGVKEQQVQRWEATEYANISFSNLQRIVDALGVVVRKEVFVPGPRVTASNLIAKLKSIGVSGDLFLKRLVPPEYADVFKRPQSCGDESAVFKVAGIVSRVFNVPFRSLLSDDDAVLGFRPLAMARFKVPANANETVFNVYAFYANFLAMLTAQATEHLPRAAIPNDWQTIRNRILQYGPRVDFKAALQFVWDCGVPVIPLDDAGAFHGAVWRIEHRNVIVLKQQKHYAACWLHDLLHEFSHAGEHSSHREFVFIETNPISPDRRESPSEEKANDLAEDVVFGNRSDQIEDACVAEARGRMDRLKISLPRVAERFNVDQGYLANYMAFVLEHENKINFWGAATNLQEEDYSPYDYAREVFFERVNLNRLNSEDREILLQGLRGGLEAHA
jgi:transcriptional regulator with XRE-family HTH domain